MIQTLLIFFGVYFAAFVMGYLIADKWVRPFGLFDVYPWKCRKCCTTWMMVGAYFFVFIMGWLPLKFIFCAILITGMNVVAFIYDERKRETVEYDEEKEERTERYEDS